MEIKKLNSLELYFKKYEAIDKEKPLKWLKEDKTQLKDLTERILKLTAIIKELIKEGDRCLFYLRIDLIDDDRYQYYEC